MTQVDVFFDPAGQRSRALVARLLHEGVACRWWQVDPAKLEAHFGPSEPPPCDVKKRQADFDTTCWLARVPPLKAFPPAGPGTALAIERGVFAAPMVEYQGDLFFGPERLATLLHRIDGRPMPRGRGGEVFHDFSSPYSYLGTLPSLHFTLRPMLLGALFKAIGTIGVPLHTFSPARQSWVRWDLEEQAKARGLPFRFPGTFPLRTVTALRLALIDPGLTEALYLAAWAEDRDIGDPAVLTQVLAEQGRSPKMLGKTKDPAIKQQLRDHTARAVELGVPGAPTFLVDGAVHWGSDRLDLLG